jgi:hypothetical protein
LRCARCRGVWYCGPKCQRAAWGAHKLACAAVAAAAAAAAAAAGAGGGGSGGMIEATVAAQREPDARGRGGGGGTGGISAATLREIACAVAMLASHMPQERAAGARTLAGIADRDNQNTRKLHEFQEAVVAAGGIPLLLRALGAADAATDAATFVVYVLTTYSSECVAALCCGGCYSSSRRAPWFGPRAGRCGARTRKHERARRKQTADRVGPRYSGPAFSAREEAHPPHPAQKYVSLSVCARARVLCSCVCVCVCVYVCVHACVCVVYTARSYAP